MKATLGVINGKAALLFMSGLLQDDPPPEPDSSPIHLIAEFLKNLAEFLSIISRNKLTNIPTSKEDLVDLLFKSNAEEVFDRWADSVLATSFMEAEIWFLIFSFFAALATLYLGWKVFWYLIILGVKAKDYSIGEIMRGQAGIEDPITYVFLRYLPAQIVIIATPIVTIWGITFLNRIMLDFADYIYGDATIGDALYHMFLDLLSIEGFVWMFFSSGAIILMFFIFIVEYLFINILVIIFTVMMMFEVARYGDGIKGVKVITDSTLYVFRFVLLIIILRLIWWIGPFFIAFVSDLGTFVVFWICAWLCVLAAFPAIYLYFIPRMARPVGAFIGNTINIKGDATYTPKSAFVQGAMGIEVHQTSTGEWIIKIGTQAYALAKKVGMIA